MFDWLRKLFHREKIDWEAERAGYSRQADTDDDFDKLTPIEEKDVAIAKTEIATGKAQSFTNVNDFLDDLHREKKERYNRVIAEKNLERQRNTLGYGVRGKFKPRPHFEKAQWKLDKKAGEEDD
jgi:hypothetical protein